MAFVSFFPCTQSAPSRRVVACISENPHSSHRKQSHTNSSKLDVARLDQVRALYPESEAELIGETTLNLNVPSSPRTSAKKDEWDTLIDDHTKLRDVIQPSHQASSLDHSAVGTTPARMAAKPSKTPKPKANSESGSTTTPKKKRGRPKGSKSKIEDTMPAAPPVSPFMSAVREDIRRKNLSATRDLLSGTLDMPSGEPIDMDDIKLSAPNGLPGDDQASNDFLLELLPIFSEQENEENRIITDEERRIRDLIATCHTQFNSIHRSSERLENLKPIRAKKKAEKICGACDGAGMVVCEYCGGQGYVDLGENGEKFNPKFGNNEFTMPKHVMANIYHCPLCGGLQSERCVSCFGTGTASGMKEVMSGESSGDVQNRAWKIFNMDELMRQEADRIEVGLDGTVILRAKRRARRKKNTKEEAKIKSPARRGRRGRPPKSTTARKGVREDDSRAVLREGGAETVNALEEGVDLAPELQILNADESVEKSAEGDESLTSMPGSVVIPRGRSMVRPTDFVNTTDYQFGRRLQKRASSERQPSSDSRKSTSFEAQDKKDDIEKSELIHD